MMANLNYCDKSCNLCKKVKNQCSAMFGRGGATRCKCDTYGGITNCPKSCNGWCNAASTAQVSVL